MTSGVLGMNVMVSNDNSVFVENNDVANAVRTQTRILKVLVQFQI